MDIEKINEVVREIEDKVIKCRITWYCVTKKYLFNDEKFNEKVKILKDFLIISEHYYLIKGYEISKVFNGREK